MRHESQKTTIGLLRQAINEWRKREGWSRETVVQMIVEAHERIDAPRDTGIRFDPTTRDAFERVKVNADRVFRWLDDEAKDTNLMPANFMPSIFAALPPDILRAVLDDMLRPVGFRAESVGAGPDQSVDMREHLCAVIKEDAEAQGAIALLLGNVSTRDLARAHRELSESIETSRRARDAIEVEMASANRK